MSIHHRVSEASNMVVHRTHTEPGWASVQCYSFRRLLLSTPFRSTMRVCY